MSGRGVVYLVGAGPGEPGLITARGLALLRSADVVVHDRLIDRALLDEAPSGAEIVDAGKARGDRRMSQDEINKMLVDRAREGLRVVRLKGGDPFVFGRGGEEAEWLAEAGMREGWELVEVMRKDSLDMTDEDRQALRTAAAACAAPHLVVIHGTDTMAQSAAALAGIPGKTIVFTGAMSPARFRQTDAPFNTGFAIAAALTAAPGIYVAMGGRLYPHDQVRKNRAQGRFDSADPDA